MRRGRIEESQSSPAPEHKGAAIEERLKDWRNLVGEGQVASGGETLDSYGRGTSPGGAQPAAVLYPGNADEVSAILRHARETGQSVYAISCGRNWGYGDARPTVDGAVLLDLGKMNRVREINTEMGYVVIEPGVSQGQLYDTLQRDAPDYWMDATGAGRSASIIGNALSRGFGHTPYADHVRSACSLEVILPDGTMITTGMGQFRNAQTTSVFPYGTGPDISGLFFQSNFGVVTAMTLWLYPKPEAFSFFYIPVQDEARFPELVDALRPLRMNGALNSAMHMGNDLRVISAHQRYPWSETGDVSPLPDPVRFRLREEHGVAPWNVSGSIAGNIHQIRGAQKALRRALRPLGLRPVFLGDRKLAWANRLLRLARSIGLGALQERQLAALEPNYGLLKGIPTDAPLEATRWRLRQPCAAPIDTDPRRLGCGLLWLSPLLPMRGEDVSRVLHLVEPILARHGFDLLVTLTSLNERTLVAVISISFDMENNAEAQAAVAAHREGAAVLMDGGYYPYRTPLGAIDGLWRRENEAVLGMLASFKHALDPQDLLASGHYVPPTPTRQDPNGPGRTSADE